MTGQGKRRQERTLTRAALWYKANRVHKTWARASKALDAIIHL